MWLISAWRIRSFCGSQSPQFRDSFECCFFLLFVYFNNPGLTDQQRKISRFANELISLRWKKMLNVAWIWCEYSHTYTSTQQLDCKVIKQTYRKCTLLEKWSIFLYCFNVECALLILKKGKERRLVSVITVEHKICTVKNTTGVVQ